MLTLLLTLMDDSTRTVACVSTDYAHGYINALRDDGRLTPVQWKQAWIEIHAAAPANRSAGGSPASPNEATTDAQRIGGRSVVEPEQEHAGEPPAPRCDSSLAALGALGGSTGGGDEKKL